MISHESNKNAIPEKNWLTFEDGSYTLDFQHKKKVEKRELVLSH